jgi:NADH dehydrogenase
MPFKSVDECVDIYLRLKTLASKSNPLPVVIVGGGLEGIEALGEILRRYRSHPTMQVHLVEANKRLLPEGPPEVDAAIRRHLRGIPVSLHTGERVARVAPRSVLLASGRRLRSAATIWTGGARPPALLFESGLAESPRDWASVHSNLVSLAFDNVLVAGDAAELPSPLSKQAYHAIDMGRCAARNVLCLLEEKSPRSFRPAPKPMLLAFGDIDTFLITGSRVIASPLLSAAKEAVFQATMAGLDAPGSRRAIDRLKKRGGQGLARLLPAGEGTWADLTRMFSLRIDGF